MPMLSYIRFGYTGLNIIRGIHDTEQNTVKKVLSLKRFYYNIYLEYYCIVINCYRSVCL